MNAKEKAMLKGQGILAQRQDGFFAIRILSKAGNFTSEEMKAVSILAEKFGHGYVSATTRLSMEIPWVKEDNIDEVKEFCTKYGLRHGGTGKRVRPLVACKGSVCVFGLCDTQLIITSLQEKFFGAEMPTKFKIGMVGCPNNCGKAQLNDIGFMGQSIPEFAEGGCKNCGKCTKTCKTGALNLVDGKLCFNVEKCINCGLCIKNCSFGSINEKERGVAVFVGGKFGRSMFLGHRLDRIYEISEIKNITEKIMNVHRDNARENERFSDMIDRLSIQAVKKLIEG